MTFLPVVERELRVAARRRGTYWGRFTAGLTGCALVAWIWLVVDASERDLGVYLLQLLSAVVFVYAAVAGTLVTCDCLSEEKREGTLGLLFLTDLKGHDVVLGKLVATSVNTFYGMLAVLPLLAIPFVLGGVAWSEMSRVVLVALNLSFCFLSIGLFVSAVCRKDNWALGFSILIGLALLILGPCLAQIPRFPFQNAAMLSSPATDCFLAFEDNYKTAPREFWINAGATQCYGWVLFGLSCWIVPKSWQDAAMGTRTRWRWASSPVSRAQTRQALLEVNPFLWRAARPLRKPMLVWSAMVVLTALWWEFLHWFEAGCLEPGMDLLLLGALGLVLKVWLALEASRTVSEDRRDGGLELLLSTPLDEREIVRGQLAALWRQFGPSSVAVLLAYLAFVIAEFAQWAAEERADLLWCHFALGGFLAADMIALSWSGMWLGLIGRKANRAALLALARVVFLPPVVFGVAVSIWTYYSGWNDSLDTKAFGLWTLLGLAASLYFGLTARHKLLAQFRTIAAEGLARKRRAKPIAAAAPVMAEAS